MNGNSESDSPRVRRIGDIVGVNKGIVEGVDGADGSKDVDVSESVKGSLHWEFVNEKSAYR